MAKNEENKDENKTEKLKEYGQVTLNHKIHLITIIGEVEGHECLPANTKTTKYEHILPQLAAIEDSREIEGVLILLNTVGGDVEAGLAIAEMIASLSKPTVSLVLRRQPFHRRADRRFRRLFLYRGNRHHGHPSGAHERYRYRRAADL